jgi:glycosyltransferase involved in cell wall biosynthesis
MIKILSVIVPVCNEKIKIEKCIRSIQDQSLTNLEIIAVNDGSTDKSMEILTSLSKSDNRSKIMNYHDNRGTSFALNMGLENAAGKFIGFTGADG